MGHGFAPWLVDRSEQPRQNPARQRISRAPLGVRIAVSLYISRSRSRCDYCNVHKVYRKHLDRAAHLMDERGHSLEYYLLLGGADVLRWRVEPLCLLHLVRNGDHYCCSPGMDVG